MAKIVEEKVETEYSGKIMTRLLVYMKDYVKEAILALVLVLVITCLELYRPMLIGDAIDLYIEGYNTPYAVVEESDLKFEGDYLSKDVENAEEFAQLILYEDNYYYFTDLNKQQSDELYEMSLEQVVPTSTTDTTITLNEYTGTLLESDKLKVLRKNDFSGIVRIGILYIVVLILNLVATFTQTWVLQLTGQNIIYSIREQMFRHIHSLPLRYFDTHPVGRIVTRVTNDVEGLHEMYSRILIRLFRNAVKIIGLAVVMLKMNVTLALYSFVLVPVIATLTYIFKQLSRKIHREIDRKSVV